MPTVAISCLIDNHPKFLMQGWNWLIGLNKLGVQNRAVVFVHHTPDIPQSRLETFRRLGAQLVEVEPFGNGPAVYCNKIQQLKTGALLDFDHVILCDADLMFLSCPTRLANGDVVRAKPVDLPNPPETVWRELLGGAGLEDKIETCPIELDPDSSTFSTNFNGGLYVLPRAAVKELAGSWTKWAEYCLERPGLLGKWHHHADQLGFGMSLLQSGYRYEHLPIGENFPCHIPASRYAALPETEIHAMHYHSKLDAHGRLKPVGIGWIDSSIHRANQIITDGQRLDFDNSIFWTYRYVAAPELGSGLGSRGETLKLKSSYLKPYFKAISQERVFDVGCGDLEFMCNMPFTDYFGIDTSLMAIEIAGAKRPDWQFSDDLLVDIEDASCDYAICLDVLIHQSSPERFNNLVSDLIRVSRKGVFVSGYASTLPNAGIVFSHENLLTALQGHAEICEVVELGSYRDVTLFLGLKKPGMPMSGADAALAEIAYGCSETSEWRLLVELVELSRDQFGFFPSTVSRTIEYPWFARRLSSEPGRRILDIGAGVCALPLWLARQGNEVATIDNSPHFRDPADKSRWNEWGFLDYSHFDKRIESHRIDAQEYIPKNRFDAIYSVSVIEHMPAALRRNILNKLPDWLAPGGRVYLSVDLIPGTVDLWPLSEGKIVDADVPHGTLNDLLDEIADAGLRIAETGLRRDIRGSRTDIAFIEAAL